MRRSTVNAAGHLFVIALVVRAAAWLFVNENVYLGEMEHPDSLYYDGIARGTWDSASDDFFHRGGYGAFLWVVYRVVGFFPVAGELLNVVLGSVLVGVVYLTAKRVVGDRAAVASGVLTVFHPALVYWSTQLLKDTLLLLLFVIAIRAILQRSAGGLIVAAASCLLIASMRPEFVVVLGAFWVLLKWSQGRRMRGVFVGLVTVVSVIVFTESWLERYSLSEWKAQGVVQVVQSMREDTDVPSHERFYPNSLPKNRFEGLRGFLGTMVVLPVVVFGAPFVWQARSFFEIAYVPMVLYWYLIVFLSMRGASRSWTTPSVRAVAGTAFIAGLLLALSVSSTAAFVRWRLPVEILALILSGAGILGVRSRSADPRMVLGDAPREPAVGFAGSTRGAPR